MSAPRFSVLVADDEPLARRRLGALLKGHEQFALVGECEDGEAVIEQVRALVPDIVFLDIQMPGCDGLTAAQAILQGREAGEHVPAIVFVTAYDQHAVRAFELEAIDYLLKPVDRDRFAATLTRVEARLSAQRQAATAAAAPAAEGSERAGSAPPSADVDAVLRALAQIRPEPSYPARFVVRDARGLYFVRAAEVERVEAEGNYVALVVKGRKHLVRETMKGIEAQLDPARFVRIHRSAIVCMDHVVRLEPWGHGQYVVVTSDGAKLHTSRTHCERLHEMLGAV